MASTVSNQTTTATKSNYVFDQAHTTVEFSGKHLMVTTVKGHFGLVTGTLVLDESDYTRSTVEATIDVTGLDSRDAKRDGHLRSADFFDVEKWPTATFKSTRIERKSDDEYIVYGDLTVRDVTREIALDTYFDGTSKSPWGTEVIAFHGTTKISRKDWGLNWNVALETGGVLVSDNITLSVDVEAVKQA